MGDGPGALVAAINERAGSALVLDGVAEHGETAGAAYVRWPDGRPGVVIRADTSLGRMHQTAEVLARARDSGLPVPRLDLLVEIADGTVAVVQERLPGAPTRRTDAGVVEAMLAMNERFAGLLVDHPDVPLPPLRPGTPEHPWHEPLAAYDDRSRRMLRAIRATDRDGPEELVGDDLVHVDFTVPNVLFDDGRISGVVDWNSGVARGDRRFALVKLRFDLTWAAESPGGEQPDVRREAIERVDAHLETTLDPPLLRLYWAHWTLRQLNYAIRANAHDVIDIHLRIGAVHLG